MYDCVGQDDGSLAGSTGITLFNLSLPTYSCALPVEWAGFEAQRIGAAVRLQWTTAQEENNSHFLVERSLDGQQFETIGQVGASGTTASPTSYQFTDQAALLTRVYYRIRQVDFDGRSTLTPIRSVEPGAVEVKVYPNPAQDRLYWESSQEVESAELWDLGGRRLVAASFPDGAEGLDLSQLPEGMYLLTLWIGQVPRHQRVVIAR